MRIRWKLLIVLLSLSLVPILMLRVNGQRGMQRMGNDLASIAREVLIKKAGLELTLLVEEHAWALRLERELIEMILRVQASELEKRIAGAHHTTSFGNGKLTAQTELARSASEKPAPRFRITGMGRFAPLSVDYDSLSQKFTNETVRENGEISSVLLSMVPVFHDLVLSQPDLIHWQILALNDGTQGVYPALPKIPMAYNALHTEWFRSALSKNGSFGRSRHRTPSRASSASPYRCPFILLPVKSSAPLRFPFRSASCSKRTNTSGFSRKTSSFSSSAQNRQLIQTPPPSQSLPGNTKLNRGTIIGGHSLVLKACRLMIWKSFAR